MSLTTYHWLLVGHIFGFTMWIGTLQGALHIMDAHAKAENGDGFLPLEKTIGIAMDIGATISLVCGLGILFGNGASTYLKGHGWMHTKLLFVVALIVVHVLTRIKIKRFKSGQVTPLPGFVAMGANLLVIGIIIMVVVRPF